MRDRLLSDYKADRVPHEAITFKEDEFVDLDRPYSQGLVETIRTKFVELIETEDFVQEWRYEDLINEGEEFEGEPIHSHRVVNWKMEQHLFDFIPELEQLINHKVKRVVQNYYGAYFQPRSVMIYRNYHVPPKIMERQAINSTRFHTDGHTTDQIKLFVYLSDVTEDHGPFCVIPGWRSKKLIQKGVTNHDKQHLIEDDDSKMFTGPPGSAALCNTVKCLHRATNPAPGNIRDMLQIQLVPSTEPLGDDWTKEADQGTVDGFSRLFSY